MLLWVGFSILPIGISVLTTALIQPSFASGELTPSLFGRVDLAKWHVGVATMRNFFVNYRGGASSRAGTQFVGASKQGPGTHPPRLIRFQFSLDQGLLLEFGHLYMRVISNGAYVTETPKIITGVTNANPGVITSAAHGFSNGDQAFLANIGGMTQLNGNIYTIANVTANTFTLIDLFGHAVNTTSFGVYTSGGTVARIYTLVSPYLASDLPALKFTQSADVMSFTHPSYPPYDLARITTNNWTLTPTVFSSVIAAPAGVSGVATTTVVGNVLYVAVTSGGSGYTQPPRAVVNSTTGTGAVLATVISGGAVIDVQVLSPGSGYVPGDTVSIVGGATANIVLGPSPVSPTIYQYVITAIDSKTGQESVASNIATIPNSVNISTILGSIKITWNPVVGASSYRVYRAPASYANVPPAGSIFGYVGTALGNAFVDNNITPQFAITPPLYINPFAPSQILSVTMTNQGASYTGDPTITITTATGSGAVLQPVVVGGNVQAVLILNAGANYSPSDTISFSGGGGHSAAGTLNIGPSTGTYPSCVAYFQQRRVYANTNNNPDTYFMSQPGSFTNFDSSPIPLDADAIIGTPWAQQVNGIQALVPVPTGLITLTGLGAWLVSGGTLQNAITPTNQDARAQAYNGCHDHIQPLVINYDILYVQAKGSIVRDLSYNLYANIYTGTDVSVLSDHLFEEHQIIEWAFAEEPFKVVWAVRDDGIMLSLTYLKEQDVQGWARHDTEGLFKSVAVVTESVPTTSGGTFADIVYVVVQRYIQGQWLYFIERMDPRLWNTLEDSWCLDSALSLPQNKPNAVLTASQSALPGRITSPEIIYGGSGYTAPTLIIEDSTGTGATLAPILIGGVITGATVVTAGGGYTSPHVIIQDATGSAAVIALNLDNTITFTASAAAFANVGDVIRMGGGSAAITSVVSPTVAIADLISPITIVVPDDPNNTPVPAVSGAWSLTTPISSVGGLSYLEGQAVKALADGNVVDDLVVTNGVVPLPAPASSIVVGLPFQAQIQSLYTDIPGEATVQGKRKNIFAVTVRVRESRGLKVGANQVDASTQPLGATVPWGGLIEIKERGNSVHAGTPIPLFTGDERINIPPNWKKLGQIAIQQDNPLPANILAFIPEIVIGDTNG